jgi:hypothetical protein
MTIADNSIAEVRDVPCRHRSTPWPARPQRSWCHAGRQARLYFAAMPLVQPPGLRQRHRTGARDCSILPSSDSNSCRSADRGLAVAMMFHPHLISKTVTEVIQIEVRAWRWCPAITCGSGAICIPAGATVRVEDDPRLKRYSSNAGGFNLQPRSSGISRMSPFPANQGGNFRPEAASPSIGFVRCGRSRISRTSSSLLRPNAPGAALAGRFSRSL